MGCYVDAIRHYPHAVGLPGQDWCHLLADTRAELHSMAAALGIPRRAFQDHPWRWHYDLRPAYRERAVALGAREVTARDVGLLLAARRRA